jgi:hypothetical protein
MGDLLCIMKPTTEDFLIPMADAIRLFVNTEDVDFVQSATKARIHAAILAKAAHDEECQRLADQWVKENKEKLNIQTSAYKFSWGGATQAGEMNFKAQVLWKRGEIWQKMRSAADSIFRDYIPENPPQE